ncbi:hypothetical protein MSUIS_05790 [Mycoplasma suis KI3806]|uniref:Uncharacterized protein n=1 Tax=Mycoplasma suis (strain KI_3806) TaxID=708248 RepID=F0V1Z1_MYCS3|nr:hypothetical protein MSUIS_05790 [Mycoplasma suis KI3806]
MPPQLAIWISWLSLSTFSLVNLIIWFFQFFIVISFSGVYPEKLLYLEN